MANDAVVPASVAVALWGVTTSSSTVLDVPAAVERALSETEL
jgi:hypothetical protein